ncbi:hypothetical protein LAZ67_7002899 [Cordylochernes scorpioides]|uniref:Dipeptidylpeptidase IV N-terminal domain-containing protein n=1 Tax=Cordylochernes scorpioides TaxID=51811 RepID=A0ABY6KTI4_9ARAC|nr:hypothetical protein LAZ67_7002899 [Cordylochernes scorpioides]
MDKEDDCDVFHVVADTELLYITQDLDVVLHDVETSNRTVLLEQELDLKAFYTIYDLASEEKFSITDDEGEPLDLHHASWGSTGSQLVMVWNHDIYYRENATAPNVQLTTTGASGNVINGLTSYLPGLGELVKHRDSQVYPSGNGTKLVLASYNLSDMGLYSINFYGDYNDNSSIIPAVRTIRYDKVGGSYGAAIPSILVVDLQTGQTDVLNFTDVFRSKYFLVISITWAEEDSFLVELQNQVGNHTAVVLCSLDRAAWKCRVSGQSRLEVPYGVLDRFRFLPLKKNGSKNLYQILCEKRN